MDILKHEKLLTLDDVMENIAELDRSLACTYTLGSSPTCVCVCCVCVFAVPSLGDILEALGEKAVISFQKMNAVLPRFLCTGVCSRTCRVPAHRVPWRTGAANPEDYTKYTPIL